MATTFLKVKNRAVSTLASAIVAGDLALDVKAGEGTKFPNAFPFHITIQNEILVCTNRVTDTLTVTRAAEGTIASSHAKNAIVSSNITAQNISDLNTAVNALESAPPAHDLAGAKHNADALADLESKISDLSGNKLALFGQVAQVVSKVVWKDASEQVLADSNRTTTLDWTDLDLTAYTSANAKFAILRVEVHIDSWTNASVYIQVRKKGTTPTHMPVVFARNDEISSYYNSVVVTIGLDSGQVIQYKLGVTGTAQADFYIQVLGYIE